MNLRKVLLLAVMASICAMAGSSAYAQARQTESWWVEKTKGGVYKAPMRPLWKLSDLKTMHSGQDNWSELIIKDPEQEATYNSGKPGYRISARMHPDTATVFVVIAGHVQFNIEGQQPIAAVRGSIVNVPRTTVYSSEVGGDSNALWVEVNPANYKAVYPAADPAPKAVSGGEVIKIAFGHTPGVYRAPNRPHWNLFQAIETCDERGAKVLDDHQFANPLINYANPADDKCPRAAGGGGSGVRPQTPFNPHSIFGHLHAGPAEWWIVQVGHISGKFENTGEFHAEEGDVLYAAPMMWHQMGVEGPGPSVRTAMGGYNLINMNNTAGQ